MRPGSVVESGFSMVAMLLLLALIMLGLSAAGPTWSHETRRDKERDLLRVGSLYALAIASYREASPGNAKQYPKKLEQLVLDGRYLGTHRHLRQLYADPVNPGQPWGLVRDRDGGIRGVYSLSEAPPLAEAAMDTGPVALPAAKHYFDWKFIAKATR